MSKSDEQLALEAAVSLHRAGKLDEATHIYLKIIKSDPSNSYALHYLGLIEARTGHIEKAKSLIARSLTVQPRNIQFLENYATILFQFGEYRSALQISEQGLKLNQVNVSLLYVSAISLFKLKKLGDALAQFDKFLSLYPDHIIAMNERASVLAEMKQYDAALASVEKALISQPQYAEAHLNKGNLYALVKRYDDAFTAYNRALALKPDLADAWLGRGNVLRNRNRYDEAFVAYDRALAFNPDLAYAWLGRGNLFSELKRHDEAFAAYDRALTLNPDLADAWLGRGNLFFELKRHEEAFAAYDKALALKPELAAAWLGRGNLFFRLKRYDNALAAYDKAMSIEPDLTGVEGARLYSKMYLCDWRHYDEDCQHLISAVKNKRENTEPFAFLSVSSSPEDERACATVWVSKKYPPSNKPVWNGERFKHDRIRVAYVSADFYEHATSYLMAAMFECHDRSQFEITGISIGPDDGSEMRRRLEKGFEHFIDVEASDDDQIAAAIEKAEIDILVDLKGFTQDARTGLFARRCAPIQINYLGYPGTMGADYIDYLIADHTVIPESQQSYYTEKIAYLPNSYQVNDAKRLISGKAFTRAELALPEEGFVFCCFNNNYKIIPSVFDCWMRILKQVEGSVLWLFENNANAASNLRKEAQTRGVNSERLVFAERMTLPDHLARHRLADLFLDTLPYNAHTTASDALWAGLPVLTQIGETFAGRVAAGLLNAIGLAELITSTPQAYESLAIELASNSGKLAHIKRKLADNRLTSPLFDTRLFTRHIEAAYTAMYERHKAGLSPAHLYVPQ